MSEESIYNLMQRINTRQAGDQTIDGEQYSHASKGNEWMAKITAQKGGGTLTQSNATNYTDHALLFDHMYDISRRTNSNAVGVNKYDSSRPRFSNPIIKIPNDVWTPSLENILINGIPVEEISLKRFSNSGQINIVVQQIDFENNIIQSMVQDDDYVWIEFRTEHYTNTIYRVSQEGQIEGQNSFTYDISKAKTAVGAAGGSSGGNGSEN